jgi:hypothetical protein
VAVALPDIASFDATDITFDSTLYTFDNLGFDTRIFGQYSWGRILVPERKNPVEFIAYTTNGVSGLTTNSSVERFNPLRYRNYI